MMVLSSVGLKVFGLKAIHIENILAIGASGISVGKSSKDFSVSIMTFIYSFIYLFIYFFFFILFFF